MNKLAIDPEELMQALTFSMDTSGAGWYLDQEADDVLLDHEDGEEELPEGFEDDPRYLYIEALPSHDEFRVMEDFLDTMPTGRLAEALTRALAGRKPFHHFKDVFIPMPVKPGSRSATPPTCAWPQSGARSTGSSRCGAAGTARRDRKCSLPF